MHILVKINLLVQEILSIISFWSKFSVFLSAVTLKIMSRSQSPNQGFSISKCCILANVGQNQVIRSGYIVPILKVLANISTDTVADADGICIKVYASHSYRFVGGYELP